MREWKRLTLSKTLTRLLGSISVLSIWSLVLPTGVVLGADQLDIPAAMVPGAGSVVLYVVGIALLQAIGAGIAFLFLWVPSDQIEEREARSILLGFLGAGSLLVTGPWIYFLIVATPVFSHTPGISWVMGLQATLLLTACFLGFGRQRLIGTRFWVSGAIPVLGSVLLWVGGAWIPGMSAPPEGVWGGLPVLLGGFLFTGLVVQYPSMLWYAWKTPVEEWGSGDVPTEEASTDAVRFESVQDPGEA